MGLIGSQQLGLGSVPTAGEPDQTGGGSGGSSSVAMAVFSGIAGDAAAPTAVYMDGSGLSAGGGGSAVPYQYPISACTIIALRLGAPVGTGAAPPTATLYKNGVATTMTCTLGAGAAAGANVVDLAHPISFVAGDRFDVRLSQPISAEGAAPFTATLFVAGGGGSAPATSFPGFGLAPPAVAAASSAGASGLASRSDHTHAQTFGGTPQLVGVGGAGAATTAARGDHGHATLSVPTTTSFAALAVTNMVPGTLCYVLNRDAWFRLVIASLTTNTWDTFASATAGQQWHRLNTQSLEWAAQATWSVDCANSTGLASDDNTGLDDAHPLRSMSELGYRLRGAVVNTFVAIRFLSNQAATDIPIFDYTLGPSGFVQLSGVPTVLFSGTISAVAVASNAGPAADDNTISCSGLAVSFTASGGLAKGIVYKRTSGAVRYWFALKETVAKTIRINRPTNAAASTFGDLAVNDTFQALTLPRLGTCKWVGGEQWKMFVDLVDDRGVYADSIAIPVFFTNTYVSVARFEEDCAWYSNCCVNAPGYQRGAGPAEASWFGGAYIGTGATFYVGPATKELWAGAIYFQGCGYNANGNAQITSSLTAAVHAYDATANVLQADYWSFILIAFVSGTGNSVGSLFRAVAWAQIAYFTAPGTVAGSTSNATPITANPTAVAAGTDIPLNAKGNGIYVTA